MDKPHSVIVRIDATADGFDLDRVLSLIERVEGVTGTSDIITLNHVEGGEAVPITVPIPALPVPRFTAGTRLRHAHFTEEMVVLTREVIERATELFARPNGSGLPTSTVILYTKGGLSSVAVPGQVGWFASPDNLRVIKE